MKISFSVSSKAQPGLKRPGGDEGSKINREYITEFDSSDSPPDAWVIPPKLNEWNPQKSEEALQLDVDSTADSVAYGCSNEIPEKLREDLDRLPDANGFDDYEEVPVVVRF